MYAPRATTGRRKENRTACERERKYLAVLAGNRILKTFAGDSGIRLAHILGEYSVFYALSNDVIFTE